MKAIEKNGVERKFEGIMWKYGSSRKPWTYIDNVKKLRIINAEF